jgi:protein FAM32A
MSDRNPYSDACPSKLKLKSDDRIKKKKKKRDKNKKKLIEMAKTIKESTTPTPTKTTERVLTKAEQSFKKMQEKMVSYIINGENFIISLISSI